MADTHLRLMKVMLTNKVNYLPTVLGSGNLAFFRKEIARIVNHEKMECERSWKCVSESNMKEYQAAKNFTSWLFYNGRLFHIFYTGTLFTMVESCGTVLKNLWQWRQNPQKGHSTNSATTRQQCLNKLMWSPKNSLYYVIIYLLGYIL